MDNSRIKHATVLIVDDKRADIKLLQNSLKNQGYKYVHSTTNPLKATHLYKKYQPDLVLLDIDMSEVSGFEVINGLKNLTEKPDFIPFIIITSDISGKTKKKALEMGAFDFISKPFNKTEVGYKVRNVLFTKLLMKEKNKINQELETRVRQRTQELMNKNIELEKAMRRVEASDRLKTEFIHNISHEVRTPLNGIVGLSEILLEKDITDDEISMYTPMFNESIERLLQTLTDYMDVSLLVSDKLESHIKEVNVASIIAGQVEKFKSRREDESVAFIKDFPKDYGEFVFYTDEESIRKIVFHLLSNASKFTRKGRIIAGYRKHEKGIIIFVSDTGTGIGEKDQERIFTHFVKHELGKDVSYEGSGLGLTIVKGFAEYFGGWVDLESEPGKGSEFQVYIPDSNADL